MHLFKNNLNIYIFKTDIFAWTTKAPLIELQFCMCQNICFEWMYWIPTCYVWGHVRLRGLFSIRTSFVRDQVSLRASFWIQSWHTWPSSFARVILNPNLIMHDQVGLIESFWNTKLYVWQSKFAWVILNCSLYGLESWLVWIYLNPTWFSSDNISLHE